MELFLSLSFQLVCCCCCCYCSCRCRYCRIDINSLGVTLSALYHWWRSVTSDRCQTIAIINANIQSEVGSRRLLYFFASFNGHTLCRRIRKLKKNTRLKSSKHSQGVQSDQRCKKKNAGTMACEYIRLFSLPAGLAVILMLLGQGNVESEK